MYASMYMCICMCIMLYNMYWCILYIHNNCPTLHHQVNNACSTGSTALYMAKQFVEGGQYVCLCLCIFL